MPHETLIYGNEDERIEKGNHGAGLKFFRMPGFRMFVQALKGEDLTEEQLVEVDTKLFECQDCEIVTDSSTVDGAEMLDAFNKGRLDLTGTGSQSVALTGGGLVAGFNNMDLADFPITLLIRKVNAGNIIFTPLAARISFATGTTASNAVAAGRLLEVEITAVSGNPRNYTLTTFTRIRDETMEELAYERNLGFEGIAYILDGASSG